MCVKISKEELALLIGNNIRKYRLKQNLTQEQLAEKVGISTSFYANLERGKKSMSIKTLRDLSDALEVSVDFILYENNTRNHIRNIEVLLNNKPESFIISMEKVIRVCTAEFSDTDTKKHIAKTINQGGGVKMGLDDNQQRFIEKLYKEMYYPLSTYALNALSNDSLAEEAVQDTFRIACAKVDDIKSSENPNGWLFNTLKYVIKNMIRSRARLTNMIISSFDFDENIDVKDSDTSDIDLLYSDIVDSSEYKLLKRIALDKYTMLEAAQELGISVEACKKRVQRAKKKLKGHLEKNK